jgi:tartronate-semialdehyde synthase
MINEAKNPLLLIGGGVVLANATEAAQELAETLKLPVITTYMAKGAIPEEHPLNAGHCGIQVGQPIGNRVFLDSDLVLGIGCRFTDRHTGAIDVYRGNRKFIHINIDSREIGKIFPADLGIVADAKKAIAALLVEAKKNGGLRIMWTPPGCPNSGRKWSGKPVMSKNPLSPTVYSKN